MSVVNVGNCHRTADCCSVAVVPIANLTVAHFVVKEVHRIECAIFRPIVEGAVVVIRSPLGIDVDHWTKNMTNRGVVGVRLHLELTDRRRWRNKINPGVTASLIVAAVTDAIHIKLRGKLTGAVDRYL